MSSDNPTETPPPSPLPLAQMASTPRGSDIAWGVIACLAAVVGTSGIITVNSGVSSYRAGLANRDEPFIFAPSDTAWLIAWLISTALLVFILAAKRRGPVRWLALGALITQAAVVPVSCQTRALPPERYQAGFCEWAQANVNNGDTIRAWAATLPPVTTPTPIPSSQWPASIASLAPVAVEQQPGGRGVTLQWGVLAAWGTSRKVFIASDPANHPPPDDPLHPWTPVHPGVYAGAQIRS